MSVALTHIMVIQFSDQLTTHEFFQLTFKNV